MSLPHHRRWKETPAGLIVPEEFDASQDRFGEIALRLPCYEPAGMTLDLTLGDLLRHLLIVGQTGSGKTTLLNRIWQELISYRSPIGQRMGLLILDSQGDHTAAHIRRLAAEAGRADDVRVLSPREGFLNPLGELDSFAALDSVASKIISANPFTSQRGGDNAYWSEYTKSILESGLVCLLLAKPGISLVDAVSFLSDLFLEAEPSASAKEIVERCNRMVEAAPKLSPGIRLKIESAQRIIRGWSKFDVRTKSILQSCLNIALLPFLAATALPYWDTSKGGRINPADALDGKIVVVCTRAATEVETAQLICRLVKMDFFGAAQNRRSLGKNTVTGLLMDEFHYAVTKGSPRWSDISNLATLRGKGVFVVAATQGLVQLDLLLGGLAAEALLINFSNLILMRSVETGHLYHLAERIFGRRPGRIVPGPLVEHGDLLVPGPITVIPPEPVCPPGALAQLETHQAFVSLANGYKSWEPVWLAPLFLPEPPALEPVEADQDLALLRRASAEAEKLSTPPVVPEASFYSLALWEFLVKAAPRQVRAMQVMSLKELRDALKGVHCEPDGLETLPPSWRLACFNLARRLRPSVQLRQVKVSEGKLSVVILPRFKGTNTIDLIQLEDRWRRSVYPTPLRPLHRRDRRWLEKNFPHLSSEIFETRKPTSP